MFIVISEDGTPHKAKVVSEAELQAATEGYVTIIDIKRMTEYVDEHWVPLAVWDDDDDDEKDV